MKVKENYIYQFDYNLDNNWGIQLKRRIALCTKIIGKRITFQDIETIPKNYYQDKNIVWRANTANVNKENVKELGHINDLPELFL